MLLDIEELFLHSRKSNSWWLPTTNSIPIGVDAFVKQITFAVESFRNEEFTNIIFLVSDSRQIVVLPAAVLSSSKSYFHLVN
jgi:hypothetical protein